MRACIIGLLAFLVGCDGRDDTGDTADTDETGTPVVDADGDGSPAGEDCDDDDASSFPGAAEVWYDGVDEACDGGDDYDQDADGVRGGDDGPDCDDTLSAVYPGAEEVCDELDNDCDTEADEEAVDATDVYLDADADGYGTGQSLGVYCTPPEGTAVLDGDCDDGLTTRRPGLDETCDEVDNDCDGYVDDSPADGTRWYPDRDFDGFGDAGGGALSCGQPDGYVADGSDCDDADSASHPGATEVCDLEDNDCDGTPDDDAADPRVYYADSDGDTYGDAANTTAACGTPTGYVENDDDCDDTDASLSPVAVELCDDAIDNDCDGTVDSDSPSAIAYHPDADGDGYGSARVTTMSCTPVTDWITDGSDCEDTAADIFPGATETCDSLDNDCDSVTDESDAVDASTWYIDSDADGYGDALVLTTACSRPSGFADNDEDCDDAERTANPGARESCDTIDNDCDTEVDEEDAYDAPSWYLDTDADGFGDESSTATSCSSPAGYVAVGGDCDDTAAAVNPAAPEAQDLEDQDCDGFVDEDYIAEGDIVVSEIARQPYAGGTGRSANANSQWFEVHNTSAYDIDMSNWYVEEQLGDHFYVSPTAALVVPAGGYVVLCYDDQWFTDAADCDYTWGDTVWGRSDAGDPYYDTTYYFDRDDDLVAVYIDGTLVDQVDWDLSAVDGATWPRTAQYSASLDDGSLDATLNDVPGAWCLANSSDVYSVSTATGSPDHGTPGEANPSCD